MASRPDDRLRISTLRSYGVLDTPNEPQFDEIVRDAARSLGTPIALISLLDEDRQWFKAKVGLEASQTPLSISFCTHAVRGPDLFVVEDATKDTRFSANPLVTGEPHIRFYAGAPLKTANGVRVGTLCVVDSKSHPPLTDRQKTDLLSLADRTMREMEARKDRKATASGRAI